MPLQVPLRDAVQPRAPAHQVGDRLGLDLFLRLGEPHAVGLPVFVFGPEVPAEKMRQFMR